MAIRAIPEQTFEETDEQKSYWIYEETLDVLLSKNRELNVRLTLLNGIVVILLKPIYMSSLFYQTSGRTWRYGQKLPATFYTWVAVMEIEKLMLDKVVKDNILGYDVGVQNESEKYLTRFLIHQKARNETVSTLLLVLRPSIAATFSFLAIGSRSRPATFARFSY